MPKQQYYQGQIKAACRNRAVFDFGAPPMRSRKIAKAKKETIKQKEVFISTSASFSCYIYFIKYTKHENFYLHNPIGCNNF
jgi:hypothetical protein